MQRVVILCVVLLGLLGGCSGPADPPAVPATWHVEELGSNAEFRDVFFLDSHHGWIVGGGVFVKGGIIGRTTDGGRSWTFTSGIARPSSRASSFHLNAVWFVDTQLGFVAADGGQLLRTIDGGEHWHPLRRGQVWAHVWDVRFVSRELGWAVGASGVIRTEDGGEHWENPVLDVSRNNPSPRGRAIEFFDSRRGWMLASGQGILSTEDGGAHWRAADAIPSAVTLRGIDFVDAKHGWVVGDEGTILHSADGGATWHAQSSGVLDNLMDVGFADARRGWAIGYEQAGGSSVVLATTDGGAEWVVDMRVPTEALRALFVMDAEQRWAVGAQQRRTDDDGSQKLLRARTAGD